MAWLAKRRLMNTVRAGMATLVFMEKGGSAPWDLPVMELVSLEKRWIMVMVLQRTQCTTPLFTREATVIQQSTESLMAVPVMAENFTRIILMAFLRKAGRINSQVFLMVLFMQPTCISLLIKS